MKRNKFNTLLRTIVILNTLYLILFFSSCKKEHMLDMFKSTGKIVTETRDLAPFNDIEIGNNKINVIITQSTIYQVKVEAGEHLIKSVTTEVRDGKLYIENENKCNFMRSYKKEINVYIQVPNLINIYHDGTGKVTATSTLISDTLDIVTKSAGDVALDVNAYLLRTHLHSCADVTVTGNCHDHLCYATGNGFCNAGSLATSYTWIFAKTTGDIHVQVGSLFIVDIESIGDVYYSGNPPTVQKALNGKGRLIPQ